MRGAGIGAGGCLSKVVWIQIKNASIVASSHQWGSGIGADTVSNFKTAISKIAIDGGHFTLSPTSGAGIGIGVAMVNLHSEV
jgi:hypothetical protein